MLVLGVGIFGFNNSFSNKLVASKGENAVESVVDNQNKQPPLISKVEKTEQPENTQLVVKPASNSNEYVTYLFNSHNDQSNGVAVTKDTLYENVLFTNLW